MIFKGLLLLCAMVMCEGCALRCPDTPDVSTALSKGISSNGFVNVGPSTFILNVFSEIKGKHETKAKPVPQKNSKMSDVITDFFPIEIVPEVKQKHTFANIDTPCHGSYAPKLHRQPQNGLPSLTSLLGDGFGELFSGILEKPKQQKNKQNGGHPLSDEFYLFEVIPDKNKKPFAPKPNSMTYLKPFHQKNSNKKKVLKLATPAEEANKLSDFEDTDNNVVRLEEEPVKGIITDKNEVNVKILEETASTVIPEMSDISNSYPNV